MQKRILCLIVGRLDRLLESDGIDDAGGRSDVKNLHDGVIDTVKGRKEVQIPSNKDEEEEFMSPHRDPLGILSYSQSKEQHQNREDVGHVSAKAENVHRHALRSYLSQNANR